MRKLLVLALISVLSPSSHAYLALLSTGEVLQPNQIQAMGYVESIFNDFDGINVNARGAYGISEDLQAEAEIGAGEFDVSLGAFVKWVPIPDYEKQPALGIRGGVSYINWENFSETAVTAMPFASKSIETDIGRVVPFGGVIMGVNSNKNDTYFSARLALGAEWTHPDQKQIHVISEVAFELSKSFSSLNIGASYNF